MKHQNKSPKKKVERTRNANSILAFTRSMAQQQNQQQQQLNKQPQDMSQIDQISSNDQHIYEGLSQNKSNPRVRITNCRLNENGIPTKLTLCLYKNHRKISEIFLGLDNEKVSLEALLSKLQMQTRALNIKSIEWPNHYYYYLLLFIDTV